MVDSIVGPAAQWIGSLLIKEAKSLFKVEEQVQGISDELEHMQQYLKDADSRQEESEINASLLQIRKLVYHAEDVIDTYVLKVKQDHRSWLARSACFPFKIPHIYDTQEKIQRIQTSLKQATENLNSRGVRRDTKLRINRQRPPSLPFDVDGHFVVGLEKDIPKLLQVLTGEGETQENILSIVGMGGSGKTTLARKLYNHPYIEGCFDCTVWVSVSQEWSTPHVLSEIISRAGLPEATPPNMGTSGVEVPLAELAHKLHNALKNKSYLVVLDDVWKREALEDILPNLPRTQNHKGSKIIITTRNRDIIQFHNLQLNILVHESRPLSNDEGWELFSKIAFSHRIHENMESFVHLGKDMLKKCDGLPLAIVALAGILNTKDNIAQWQHVSEAVRSRVMDGTGTKMYGRVRDMLALSYNDLSYSLKPCFLYLGLFPEDSEISAGMLTRMWIAEGLVSTSEGMSLEDEAMRCLEELSHRFMVQVVRTNAKGLVKAIRLHDLLREFCLKKAKELSFLQTYTPVSGPGSSVPPSDSLQPRRAALHSSVSLPLQISNLRSLVLLTRSRIPESIHDSEVSLDLIKVPQNFRLLRLLNLRSIRTVSGKLTQQIGILLHLRYLEIRGTNIVELPSSIGNLKCLLVLDYRDVNSRENVPIKIPNVLWKLVQLRHLFLPSECPWSVKELKLSTLKSLQTLWGMKQDSGGQWLTKEVSQLSPILKKLKIVVSSDSELEAVFSNPSLRSDGLLQTFHCELKSGIAVRNVEPLSPCGRLHKLILIGEVNMKLPLLLPTNIVTLELKNCVVNDEDPMSALGGLAHLKLLTLVNAFATASLACKPGSFPQLEELYLESLQSVRTWKIEVGALPRLKKLEITKCWCLQEFPRDLKVVTTLQRLEFFEMPPSFGKKATEYGWSSQKLRLPHNCVDIIKRSVSPVDSFTIRKLCEQLTVGIFLDSKNKKYWISRQNGSYYNCFMVYASDLVISDVELRRGVSAVTYKEVNSEDETEGGSMLRVAEIKRSAKVSCKFNTADLSVGLTYEIQWVIMLEGVRTFYHSLILDDVDEDDVSHVCTELSRYGEDGVSKQTSIIGKPIHQWFQVAGGKFETHPMDSKEMECSLIWVQGYTKELALVVKGFLIQPNP